MPSGATQVCLTVSIREANEFTQEIRSENIVSHNQHILSLAKFT